MKVQIKPDKWMMYCGIPIVLPNHFVETAVESGLITEKQGSQNGEMVFVDLSPTPHPINKEVE